MINVIVKLLSSDGPIVVYIQREQFMRMVAAEGSGAFPVMDRLILCSSAFSGNHRRFDTGKMQRKTFL